jgi:GT2 family glycosyltransferase
MSAGAQVVTGFEAGIADSDAGPGTRTGLSVVVCTRGRPRSLARFLDSLRGQSRRPTLLLIVDASPDRRAELMVLQRHDLPQLAGRCCFRRVTPALTGLTRQRNFALDEVRTDLVAFFDDDVVLEPGCLAEMEARMRSDAGLIGVGGVARNERGQSPSLLWRLRRRLGIVDTLEPGRYCRSGISIPWGLLPGAATAVPAEWLPGYAMMWRTPVARVVRFNETFEGYANGEDLDFSLRMARHGRLQIAGAARFHHLHDPAGRPDAYRLGLCGVRNAVAIHRRCLADRRAADVAWLVYAFALDTVLQCIALLRPPGMRWRWAYVRGRLAGLAAAARPGNGEWRR